MKAAAATTVRRFEFSEGSSNKFWELGIEGSQVTVRFGRIGTQGQSSVKSFPDEVAAIKHAESLVKQKTGKGYLPVK